MHLMPRRRTASRWVTVLVAALVAAACTSVDREDLPYALPTDDDPSGRVDTADAPDAALTVDDDVEIGTLDNGLTYYMRENQAPGGSVTVRLVVDAGSRQQVAPDDGVAHFLEHMLFNGTERWPGNELDRVLQTLGAGIGPDINAYTSFDETVYELTVSTFDDEAVETAFAVLAEWSARATIDPAEVIAERGVVRDEYRQRVENSAATVGNALLDIYVADTPYDGRAPIGSVAAIEATEAPALRAFYERWYHPENMAVVVVGDLSVTEMRRHLEQAFDQVDHHGPPPERPTRLEIQPDPAGLADVFTHPEEVVDNLSVDWLRPPSDPATVEGARIELLDDLIVSMLTSRLDDAYLAGRLAVDRSPSISRFGVARHLEFFGTNLRGTDLALAYTQLLGFLLAAAEDGFTAAELADAIRERESALSAWEDAVATTNDLAWSQGYVNHFLTGVGAEAPATTIQRERDILETLDVDELSRRWASIHQQSGPIAVALGADEQTLPTVAELEAIAANVAPIAPAERSDAIAALMEPPAPVEPDATERRPGTFGSVDIRRYANGATVVFERTPIVSGSVSLWAESLGGASLFAVEDHPLASLVTGVVGGSGFETVSAGELDGYLSTRTATLAPYIADYTEGFEGGAGTDDVETLLQLLHLAVTEPSVDEIVLRSALVDAEAVVALLETDPGLRAEAALGAALVTEPARAGFPTEAHLASVSADHLLDLYRARLGTVDDLIVTIVGDAEPSAIAELADRYVGTLPAGPTDTFVDRSAPPPSNIQRIDIPLPEGSGDAGFLLRWETRTIPENAAPTAAVAGEVISRLIFETAREELGASYGGGASAFVFETPHRGLGGFVSIDGDPARLDEIQDRLFDDLGRLARVGPTDDELDRAVAVLVDDLQFINNVEIQEELMHTERFGEVPALSIADRVGLVGEVSAQEVRELIAALFTLDAYLEIRRS